ncbi:AI-2E family transporter [Microlunatus parietis]|uniref:Putative PurR-regulated permease PerM n=1 Tax=Microlunatus parietis TaxID=682979 RepID=A0A7Y9I855_9ACTN|nr:AI-2E family transporter [Microlunatus parietis]NYE71977.1 putative PurR-regulated permease PerM [Microlunatus parietis]
MPGPRSLRRSLDRSTRSGPPDNGWAPPLWGVLVAAGIVIAAMGIREIQGIAGPVFLVLTLVITVHPFRVWLRRVGVPAWLASTIALFTIYGILVIILGSIALSITQLATTLPKYGEAFVRLYNLLLDTLAGFGVGTEQFQSFLDNFDPSSLTGIAQSLLSSITNWLSLGALMVTVVVFLAFDASGVGPRLEIIRKARPRVAEALENFARNVRKYWIVTSLFGFIVSVFDVIALSIIGVPLAVTWGVFAFVTNYIPNVGFVVGMIPPALLALLSGGDNGPRDMLAVIISFCVINFVIQTLIQPKFTGDAVGITPTVAFLSLIFWSFILGGLGALLAVPATLFVKAILIDMSDRTRWFSALISATPDEPAAERPIFGFRRKSA